MNRAHEAVLKVKKQIECLEPLITELKNYDEAVKAYDKAIEINPNLSSAYSNKGLVMDDLKRYEDAIK